MLNDKKRTDFYHLMGPNQVKIIFCKKVDFEGNR